MRSSRSSIAVSRLSTDDPPEAKMPGAGRVC